MKPPTRWTSTFTYFCTIFLEYLEALRIWCSPSNFLHFVQVSDRRNGLSIRYSTIVVTWHRKTDLRPTKRGFDMQKEANKSIYLKRNTIWMDLWWWLVRPILKHDVCASHTSLQGWYSRLSDQRCENFLTGWPVVDLRFDYVFYVDRRCSSSLFLKCLVVSKSSTNPHPNGMMVAKNHQLYDFLVVPWFFSHHISTIVSISLPNVMLRSY